ncbi:MAG: class I SAM-dependent methyltransferase, partial [Caldilineaceae bacterium]|nr:class I SAM-dependent methyltransferase [Caldilineaceae bacterium]
MTLRNQTLFFEQFRRNFTQTGAIMPSSPALGQAASAHLARPRPPARILEAGAGTGSFTREIIPLLIPGDRLDVVEISSELTGFLQQRLIDEGLLRRSGVASAGLDIRLINADLLQFPFDTDYDFIIFSLPLTNFPPDMVAALLAIMMQHLRPGGVFSYVKYIFIGQFKYYLGGAQTRAKMDGNQAIIQDYARQYQFERSVVVANVPSTWVNYW